MQVMEPPPSLPEGWIRFIIVIVPFLVWEISFARTISTQYPNLPTPWSRNVSLLNGTILLLVDTVHQYDMGGSRYGIVIVPLIVWALSFIRGVEHSYDTVTDRIYSCLVGILTISGVIRLTESYEPSYGVLLGVPILVLCALDMPSTGNRWIGGVESCIIIATQLWGVLSLCIDVNELIWVLPMIVTSCLSLINAFPNGGRIKYTLCMLTVLMGTSMSGVGAWSWGIRVIVGYMIGLLWWVRNKVDTKSDKIEGARQMFLGIRIDQTPRFIKKS